MALPTLMKPTDRRRLDGIHILLVEDNEDARYVLEHTLRHYGALVTTATNGEEGLALFERVTPHVIVSDITMPGMTGLDMIRAIRALPGQRERPTPAIAATAYPYRHERNEALEAGFDAFVVKPVDPDEIVSYIAVLFERPEP